MNVTPIRSSPEILPITSLSPSVVNPLCIILVKNGSKGDRLLFRYPYSKKCKNAADSPSKGKVKRGGSSSEDAKNSSFQSSSGGTKSGSGGLRSSDLSFTANLDSSRTGTTDDSHANSSGAGGDGAAAAASPEDQSPQEVVPPGATATATTAGASGSGSNATSPVQQPQNSAVATLLTSTKSPAYLGTTSKSMFDTPLSQLSSKSFTSPGAAAGTPDFGLPRMRKISRTTTTTAPVICRGDGDNPYSVAKNPSDDLFTDPGFAASTTDGRKFSLDGSEMLSQLSDKDLSNLLAVNSDLAERKFELKLNFVRFVGHPTLMHNPRDVRPINPEFQTSVKIFHVIFCLNAAASHSIVKCFFDLSKRLGIGLRHEEYRCGFLNQEMRKIIATHDEACTVASEHHETDDPDNVQEKVFDDILSKSKLAQLMKRIYDDVCNTGYTFARINNWVQISFCLPHRVHVLPFRKHAALVEPETIHRCLEAIRPYHAILLLVEPDSLISRFWLDCSSTIPRLLQVYSPLKSLQTLAADADLTLSQVVEIASHLVYWAHATVIYPLCESNVYFMAPDLPIDSSELEAAFRKQFPQLSMVQVFADFSHAIPLGERMNPMIGGTYAQSQLVELVTWMLQRRLLIQLHTYIYMATYLDVGGNDQLDQINVSVDPDISLNLNSLRPFYFPEEDDATVSDTFSEVTAEEVGLVSPLPVNQEQFKLQTQPLDSTQTSEDTIKSATASTSKDKEVLESPSHSDTQSPTKEKAKQQNNNNDEIVEPLDKFRSSLPELNNEAVKRALGMVNKASISLQDIKMFSKLAKYFSGEFHIEEIMYRENVRRSQLLLLLDKFRECLITVEKEDADISFFRVSETFR